MAFRLNRSVVVLLAVFLLGLGGVAHGYAAAITAQIPAMAGAEVPPSDESCGQCSGDAGVMAVKAACQAVCTSSALLGSTFTHSMSADSRLQITALGAEPGIAGRPDPYPPKPVSLS